MLCFTSQATGAFVELSKCLSFLHPGIHHHFDSISVILFSNHQRHKNQRIVLSGSRPAQRRITWITYIGPMDYLHRLLLRKTHSAFLRKTTRLRNFFSLKNSSNRPEKNKWSHGPFESGQEEFQPTNLPQLQWWAWLGKKYMTFLFTLWDQKPTTKVWFMRWYGSWMIIHRPMFTGIHPHRMMFPEMVAIVA